MVLAAVSVHQVLSLGISAVISSLTCWTARRLGWVDQTTAPTRTCTPHLALSAESSIVWCGAASSRVHTVPLAHWTHHTLVGARVNQKVLVSRNLEVAFEAE